MTHFVWNWHGALARAAVLMVTIGMLPGCSRTSVSPTGEIAWQSQGPIRVLDGNVLVIGEQLVTLSPNARVIGEPKVGVAVRAAGTETRTGRILAEQVEVLGTVPPASPSTTGSPNTSDTLVPTGPPGNVPPRQNVRPNAEDEDDEKDDDKDKRGRGAGSQGNRRRD